MGNGCFLCPKKIAPRPIPVVIPTVTTVPTIVPKEKPFGYVKLYAGKHFLIFDYYILSFNQ
jgi:hypothetical protein